MPAKLGRQPLLIALEGPDGVGKTTLAKKLSDWVEDKDLLVHRDSSPGSYARTLGSFIYSIHHSTKDYFDQALPSSSLQLLHIAAHIDMVENRIKPALDRGKVVILDRFWWSTQVYGRLGGIPEDVLEGMRMIELTYWSTIKPVIFLIDNDHPHEPVGEIRAWRRLRQTYLDFAAQNSGEAQVTLVTNDNLEDAFTRVLEVAEKLFA